MNLAYDDILMREAPPRERVECPRRALGVLLIEDESVIATDIGLIVNDLGLRLVGPARTHREAVSLARKSRPAVVIADVKLADGSSGVIAVDEALKSVDAAVIFVTAVPQWLQTGAAEPFFVVPKPYSHDAVRSALARATAPRAQAMAAIAATKAAVGRLARKQ